jgi:hypothetical protein
MRRALLLVVALVVSSIPNVGGAARARAAADDWRAQVGQMLARRAAAVIGGDRAAFDATMAAAPSAFKARELRWFDGVRALELRSYELILPDDTWSDLARGVRAAPPGADEVHVVVAVQRLAVKDFDDAPTYNERYLTVVRRARTWSIAGDDDVGDLGLLSVRDLWDFGATRAVRDGNVLVLTRDDLATARKIAAATKQGIAYVRARWPYAWPARALVMIPKTSAELTRILRATFDLGPFVAFTTSDVERTADGGFKLLGHRVFVQPSTFFGTPASYQRDTLSHELTHLATRAVAGPWQPAWLDEGVAQVYGERSNGTDAQLRAAARAGTVDLPEDWQFSIGSRASIHLSYEEARSFVTYLNATFGATAGARLYRAVGAESVVAPGTGGYHLDRAARRTFGRSFDSLRRAWIARVTTG